MAAIKGSTVYQLRLPGDCKLFTFKCSVNITIKKSKKNVEIQGNYQNLWDITLNNYDTKCDLSIDVILSISVSTKIKTPQRARIRLPREHIAELTKLGWYKLSSVKENYITNILFSQKSIHDYEKLYESSSFGRWSNRIRSLDRLESLEAYDEVMQDQIGEGIVEKVIER